MKVLEVISSLKPIGGGETFAVNISRSFQKFTELKVVILYKDFSQMFIDRLNEMQIDYVFLDKQKHFDKKNAKEIAKIIKEFQPDVIHTENNALIPTYLALKSIKKSERPRVFHTMHLAPVDECSNKLVRILYRYIFKKKGFTPVAITEKLARESEHFYHLKHIPYVENGIDLSRFDHYSPLNKREYDLVVLARFSYQKNHEFLIRTLARIHNYVPNLKAAFVGGGELFEKMKELANTSGANFIEFTGVMENTAQILMNSKIIALGSRFEANPLSLLEGMASGCIVISSDVGGIRNIIKEDNGFLFDLDDDETFIKYVVGVLRNLNKYQCMSENNVKYSNKFSMDECAKKYINLFQNKII